MQDPKYKKTKRGEKSYKYNSPLQDNVYIYEWIC